MSKFSICLLCYPKKQALFVDAKAKTLFGLVHGIIDLSKFKHNRDREEPHDPSPPTPPDIRITYHGGSVCLSYIMFPNCKSPNFSKKETESAISKAGL